MAQAIEQPVLVLGLGVTGLSVLRYLSACGMALDATDARDERSGVAPDYATLRARYPQARFTGGALSAPRPLAHYRSAVISPGIPLQDPFVRELADAGLTLLGDIELFARHVQAPVIAITGSNGKSTTTTLLGEIVAAAGHRVAIGGNLGRPALDLLGDDAELYVLELSSFQLETTHTLAPRAATVLNLSEDHLDRHGDMAAYAAAKARIYARCSVAVINRDDTATAAGSEAAARTCSFGLDVPPAASDYGLLTQAGEDWLARGDEPLLPVASLRLRGRHNIANALAALALAEAAGIEPAAALPTLRDFAGLPHRCEWVAEVGGITWLNDSKATNVGAALAAIEGLDGPLLWLGGGQGKGQDFTPLAAPLAQRARAAVVFGADADALAATLAGHLPVHRVRTLAEAVAEARGLAQPGDTVLLSPACASLDQFKDYAQRGTHFATLARQEDAP